MATDCPRGFDCEPSGTTSDGGAAGTCLSLSSAGSGGCQVGMEETTTGWSLGAVAAFLWARRRGPTTTSTATVDGAVGTVRGEQACAAL